MTDLPEPKKISLTPEERRSRRRKLLETLIFAVAAYACIHKLIIPIVLKFTSLSASPHARIDPWFLHPWVLYALLKRSRDVSPLLAFVCGGGIFYGAGEIYLMWTGHTDGWLAVSHFVSSLPIAGSCIFVMTKNKKPVMLAWAFLGAVLAALGLALVLWAHERWQPIKKESLAMQRAFVADTRVCGARKVQVLTTDSLPQASTIEIKPCGLSPRAIQTTTRQIIISSKVGKPTNLHLIYLNEGRRSTGWNRLLQPGGTLTEEIDLSNHEVAMLYSDSDPKAGIVGIVRQVDRAWQFQRSPIRIKGEKK